MKLRKSIPGTFILIIYACLFLTMAAATIYHVVIHYDMTGNFELHSLIAFLVSVILILISAFIPWHNKVIEALLVVTLLSVLFVIRLQAVWSIDVSFIDQNLVQSVMIGTKQISSVIAKTNTEFIYHVILKALFLFFGNKIYPILLAQAVMQCAGLLILSTAIRKTAGSAPALLTLAAFGFQPELVSQVTQLTPDVIVFLCISLGIYATFSILVSKSFIRSIFSGLLIALVCFIDSFGVVLIAISFLFLVSSHTRLFYKKEETLQLVRLLFRFLLLIIFIIVGLIGLFLTKTHNLSFELLVQVVQLIHGYYMTWVSNAGFFFNNMAQAYLKIPSVIRIIMILPALFVVIGYWKVKYDTVYAATVLFISAHLYAGMVEQSVGIQFILMFAWIGISAVGICQLFMIKDNKKDASIPIENDQVMDRVNRKKEVSKKIINKDDEKQEVSNTEVKDTMPEHFLHNPLPVPPRHVKKTMEYAFEPEEATMHYDVALSEDKNDYDI